jgi:hypothetical protein
VFLELCAVGAVGSEDDLALESDDDLGLGGGVEFRQAQTLQFLLVDQDDVDALLEFVDDAGLQVFVEGYEGLTGATPGRMDIDNQQLGVPFIEVGEEVVRVANHRRQLHLLCLLSHLSYIITPAIKS